MLEKISIIVYTEKKRKCEPKKTTRKSDGSLPSGTHEVVQYNNTVMPIELRILLLFCGATFAACYSKFYTMTQICCFHLHFDKRVKKMLYFEKVQWHLFLYSLSLISWHLVTFITLFHFLPLSSLPSQLSSVPVYRLLLLFLFFIH